MPPGQALQKAGMTLVMKVGGASGPLYGSLLMGIGKSLAGASAAGTPRLTEVSDALQAGVDMVRKRGKSDVGEKTMLDVLVPVCEALRDGVSRVASGRPAARRSEHGRRPRPRVHPCAPGAQGPRLVSGRAQRRPPRPRGSFEPDHRGRRVREPAGRVVSAPAAQRNVGVVIVSHSPRVARGAEDMVRQMVGESVPLAACGGNPDGGLGTDVAAISAAIDAAWSERGVAVLVDLGGAEMNTEMAIEMLDERRRRRVTICNAAIVEGGGDGGDGSVDGKRPCGRVRGGRGSDMRSEARVVITNPTGAARAPRGQARAARGGIRRAYRDPRRGERRVGAGAQHRPGDEAQGRRAVHDPFSSRGLSGGRCAVGARRLRAPGLRRRPCRSIRERCGGGTRRRVAR